MPLVCTLPRIEYIFKLFGIDDDSLIHLSSEYIKYSITGMLFNGFFDITRIYLCGQNYFHLPFQVKFFSAIINIILCEILVEKYKLKGLAIAYNISEIIGFIVLIIQIYRLKLNSWIGLSINIFLQWWDYFKFILPGGIAFYLHYLYFDLLTFFIIQLKDNKVLSVHISFSNLRGLFFAIPLGTSVSVASFIG